MWQKTFGREAKHIVEKQGKANPNPAQAGHRQPPPSSRGSLKRGHESQGGYDGNKHARTDSFALTSARFGRPGTQQNERPAFGRAAPSRAPPPKVVKEEENLHPSWVAKRKAKEQQMAPLESFQGTKVVFDDD